MWQGWPFGQETALAWTVWGYAVWTGHTGSIEKWLLNLPKGETVLQGFCFMKESAIHSAGYRRKCLTNCKYRWNCFWNFLLHGKVCGYHGPVGWRWMPQRYKRTLGNYPGSEMSLSFLEFGSCLFLVYLGSIISFWSLWWSWRMVNYSYSFP